MKLTSKTVTKEVLEALAVDGTIYLVQINTDKPGYHYICGFKSKEQAKMYRALLEGRNYEYGYFSANEMTVEEAYSNIYIEATTTFTPVTQYRISKNDNVKSTHPEHTSKTLLRLADELLANQHTQKEETEYRCTDNDSYQHPNCDGYKDYTARQGYYIKAINPQEALNKMLKSFLIIGTVSLFKITQKF